MADYTMTIGLEIHSELKTRSKMFCGCPNQPEEISPNLYVCPICMGHPGTLPVINKEAVKKVLLVGKAAQAELADFTEFDRKNYFYPDIPKGYQISQYKYPLVSGGKIGDVTLTRIHLEEDTARSSHELDLGSLVDFNRAGVPLMELVTEPVIHSSEQAVMFAKELQLLLQYLKVSDANMEKGEMRVEVNISISKTDESDLDKPGQIGQVKKSPLGTKVEVKNINSFRAVGRAIDFEFKRQKDLLERGEKVIQETRGWDENKGITFSQRLKESAHDYRYFPDPDLPKLVISEIPELSDSELEKILVELPWQKRVRYNRDFSLKKDDIEVYINYHTVSTFFESVVEHIKHLGLEAIQSASNYITSDLVGLSKTLGNEFTFGKMTAPNFAELITMIKSGEISSRGAKDILKIMFENGGNPKMIAEEKSLIQKNDTGELKKIINEIISANPKVVEEYKAGKESAIQFLVGQGMKATKGSANPEILKSIILETIK